MESSRSPRAARSVRRALGLTAATWLAGCQSYQPAPLDLAAHDARVAARLSDDTSLDAFSRRLMDHGARANAALDLADGINPAEAEVIALFYNPSLRRLRGRAGVALANAENAGLWTDPVLGFDGAELLSPTGPFEFGLTASLTLPVSGRLEVEKDRAGAVYGAELRRIVEAEWTLRAKVRAAWAAWTVATERLRLLDRVVEEVTHVSQISDRLEAAGELTRIEGRLLRSELIGLRVKRFSAAAAVEQTRLALAGLMGLRPDAPLDLKPVLPVVRLPQVDDAAHRIIQSNPLLAVHRAEYAVAEETLRLEVRKQYPDIEIGAGFGSEEDDDRLLLGAALPLPFFNANRAGIAEARAERERVRAAARGAFARLTFALASTRARLRAAEQQQSLLREQLAPLLDEQADEIARLADLGEVDTLILLETVTRRFEAKEQILDLQLLSLRARIETARLLGPDTASQPAPVADPATRDANPTPRIHAQQGTAP